MVLCTRCGCFIESNLRELHDRRMHPILNCIQMGCGVYHPDGHKWEEQFWEEQ